MVLELFSTDFLNGYHVYNFVICCATENNQLLTIGHSINMLQSGWGYFYTIISMII